MSEQTRSTLAPEQRLLELKALAASLPTVELTDPRVGTVAGEAVAHTQHRGNFFRRFLEMQAVAEGTATESQVTYIRMVKERFGLDLSRFQAQHPQLCGAICDALAAKEPYDRLVEGHTELVDLETSGELPPGSAAELHIATEHPLGLEAIGMYYWDGINPLLEEAYVLLEAKTMNAPFLAA